MSAARGEKDGWPERVESYDDALSALIRLSRRTTHEVSNALTAVLGYLDLASGQLDEQDPAREAIAKAVEAAHAAAGTIQDFSAEVLQSAEASAPATPLSGKSKAAASSQSSQEAASSAIGKASPGPGESGVVLFAVADSFIRSILLTGLRAAGREIVVASDLGEILHLCAELESRRPVLVVDAIIDGMKNGRGAARIRKEYPSLPVILLSTGSKALTEVDEEPMLSVIHKPFPIARLLEEIDRCRFENGDESP